MERIDVIQTTGTSLAEGGSEVERIDLLWGLHHHKQFVHSKQIFLGDNELTNSYRIFNTLLDGDAKESCERVTKARSRSTHSSGSTGGTCVDESILLARSSDREANLEFRTFSGSFY